MSNYFPLTLCQNDDENCRYGICIRFGRYHSVVAVLLDSFLFLFGAHIVRLLSIEK